MMRAAHRENTDTVETLLRARKSTVDVIRQEARAL
jgi:hypothetical protein